MTAVVSRDLLHPQLDRWDLTIGNFVVASGSKESVMAAAGLLGATSVLFRGV